MKYCERCGTPIPNDYRRKYCEKCAKQVIREKELARYHAKPKQRYCEICGTAIEARRRMCDLCKAERRKITCRENSKKHRQNKKIKDGQAKPATSYKSMHELARLNDEARRLGMSYGQYMAMKGAE
jgi:hypothetical protein